MPTGSSIGAIAVRATRSQPTRNAAPNNAEAGSTTMRYVSDLQIGGKIAAVGQRVLDAAARAMTQKGLDAMQRELETRLARGQAG